MEDLIENLTRGNVTEVKVVLASVVLALAAYQLVLAAVSYGKVRPRFLESGPATWAHRVSGDTILVLAVLVAVVRTPSARIWAPSPKNRPLTTWSSPSRPRSCPGPPR